MATLTYTFEGDTAWAQPAGWAVIDYGAGTPISRVEPTLTNKYQLSCSDGIYAKCTDVTAALGDIQITGTRCFMPFGSYGMVFARHNEGNIGAWNTYRMYVGSSGTANRIVYLDKFVAGSQTALANSGAVPLYFSYWVDFKFEVVGTTIRAKLWENGTAEPAGWTVSTTDGDIASGKVALGASGNSGTYFDNISIESDDIPEVIPAPLGTLSVTGYDPAVDLDVGFSVSPLGIVKVAGYDPVVTFFGIVDQTLGSLVVTGKTPTVGIETPVVQGLGSLTVKIGRASCRERV